MRRALLALLAFAVLSVFLTAGVSAAAPLVATIDGPAALAPGQIGFFNVTVTRGPTAIVTYTVLYYIPGTNTTGGSPVQSAPVTKTGNETRLEINITAPTTEQEINLFASVSAKPTSGLAENATATYAITVIKSVVLTATFHNSATTAALNVTVLWYVDDNLVGTSHIAQIAANGDATVSFNYLPLGLATGEHSVRAEADLDHDGVIDPARGEVVTSTLFYEEVQPLSVGWTILIGIGVFVPVFLGVVAFRRRGQR